MSSGVVGLPWVVPRPRRLPGALAAVGLASMALYQLVPQTRGFAVKPSDVAMVTSRAGDRGTSLSGAQESVRGVSESRHAQSGFAGAAPAAIDSSSS